MDESDLDLFIEMSMSPMMMKYVSDPSSLEEAQDAFITKSQPWTIESDGWLALGITKVLSNEKLGNIGLKIINHEERVAEVGFMIKSSAQGKGFASEALRIVKNYAFIELGLNKLVATCAVNNYGSYKLLEKHGFIRESCLKHNVIIGGEYIDDYIYGLCKSAL